jgi:NAD+ synthase (glutamine-hydrolysing)
VAEVYRALVVGTGDYVRKSGFQKVVIGVSGGIDSALTAAVAVDALGPENVLGVAMPSGYSSSASLEDATLLAGKLGMRLETVPIGETFDAYRTMLSGVFAGQEEGLAEENIQARIRGNILMGISNKFGWLVLATGNKSEYATGYTTLYGDMAGGFAVIKDVPKTLVYELCERRNGEAGRDLIPRSIMEKAPTAELRPNQLDTDSLPPYPLLDPVLEAYVERDVPPQKLLELGFAEEVVRRAVELVDRSEYKRRQAPPGVKITERAFGKDRRLPIVSRFKSL